MFVLQHINTKVTSISNLLNLFFIFHYKYYRPNCCPMLFITLSHTLQANFAFSLVVFCDCAFASVIADLPSGLAWRALRSNSPTLANPYCRWNLSKILLFLCLILWNRFFGFYTYLKIFAWILWILFLWIASGYALAMTILKKKGGVDCFTALAKTEWRHSPCSIAMTALVKSCKLASAM